MVRQVLYSFPAYAQDGLTPYGNLIFDAAGNLYGTTYLGGGHNCASSGIGCEPYLNSHLREMAFGLKHCCIVLLGCLMALGRRGRYFLRFERRPMAQPKMAGRLPVMHSLLPTAVELCSSFRRSSDGPG